MTLVIIEREVGKSDRAVQTNPTRFERDEQERNNLTSEDKFVKADEVVHSNPTNNEIEVGKADSVLQTDPTSFEREEEEKKDDTSDDSEMGPIVTKKPTVESIDLKFYTLHNFYIILFLIWIIAF